MVVVLLWHSSTPRRRCTLPPAR